MVTLKISKSKDFLLEITVLAYMSLYARQIMAAEHTLKPEESELDNI